MTQDYTRTRPPPTELLATTYLAPLMLPTPVASRLPKPADTEDTVAGFLRVEAGGGVMRPDQLLWDVSVILHAYAPNTQEAMAEQLINDAIFWAINAEGTTTVMSNGDQWYITYARCPALASRKADPMVPMTRYRAMITWRMPGQAQMRGQPLLNTRIHLPAPASAGGATSATALAPSQQPGAPRPSRRRTPSLTPRR